MKKILIIALMLGCVAVYAQAQFTPYGSARMALWYEMEDEEMSQTGEERFNMDYFLQKNSLAGARYRATNLNARVELGASGSFRLLWAKYNMGSYSIHAGLDETLVDFRGSMVYGGDFGLVGWGAIQDNLTGQIRIELNNGIIIALLEPSLIDIMFEDNNVLRNGDDSDVELHKNTLLPKLNVGYQKQLTDFLKLNSDIGFNMYEYTEQEDLPDTLPEEAVMSFVLGIMFDFDFDAFDVKLHLNAGQNTGNYGLSSTTINTAFWDNQDKKIVDIMSYGGFIELGYQLNDNSKVTAGASFTMSESDEFEQEDTAMALFGQFNHKLGNRFMIIPEVGLLDAMEDSDNNEQGSMLYFGTQLRIDF